MYALIWPDVIDHVRYVKTSSKILWLYLQQNASGDEFHLADYIFNSNTHPRLQSMLTKLPEKQQEKVNRNRKSPEK